jgi:hypothetical protein
MYRLHFARKVKDFLYYHTLIRVERGTVLCIEADSLVPTQCKPVNIAKCTFVCKNTQGRLVKQ